MNILLLCVVIELNIQHLQQLASLSPSLSTLMRDYLNGDKSLKSFFGFTPDLNGLKAAAESRIKFPVDREGIVNVLTAQAKHSKYATNLTYTQINRLKQEDVFTVTTGHQLCVYGGPMFFIYKILSVISLCKQLEDSGIKAIPIFWMASEDHDFEEVNHIYFDHKKYVWNRAAGGPVGRLKLNDLDQFKSELENDCQSNPLLRETLKTLESLYHPEKDLAEATRDLVYWLFATHGVVVLDADHPDLKRAFLPHILTELREGHSSRCVKVTSKSLQNLGYATQVTPRDINLFWMQDSYRERITKNEYGFQTADGKYQWTAEEIKILAETSPQNFSPNVVMRPMYQECILPNLAYVGGPGELSYWLQLKAAFDQHGIFFPAVILRDMALLVDSKTEKRMKQIEVTIPQMFQPKSELFSALVRLRGTHEHLVDHASNEVDKQLQGMIENLSKFDPTLEESAKAERKRILKRLETLRKKVLRSERKRHTDLERRMDEVFAALFPNGVPQERVMNWLNYTNSTTKSEFINALSSHFNPLDVKIKALSLEK